MNKSLKLCIAQKNFIVGDLNYNLDKILKSIRLAKKNKVDIICFPELAITGYPPEDLLLNKAFQKEVVRKLDTIISESSNICCIVGYPFLDKKKIFNSALIIKNKKILGRYDKRHLPNYGVFDEKRYFTTGKENFVFFHKKKKIMISICEDIWISDDSEVEDFINKNQPDLLINISASPFSLNKQKLRKNKVSKFAKKNNIDVIYCNLVGAQDELIFDGNSMAIGKNGVLVGSSHNFKEQDFQIKYPFKKIKNKKLYSNINESIIEALVLGIKDYVNKNGFQKVLLGISGGIDSAMVAALSCLAVGKKNVYGIAMPTIFNSDKSLQLALELKKNLGFHLDIVNIQDLFENNINVLHSDLLKGFKWDVTEENLQSRIRSNILMAVSNKKNYLLLSTGNKSEMSVGYSTIYGDLSGGLAPLKDIPKTLVYDLAKYLNKKYLKIKIPINIIKREPSAELRLNQKDADSLPPYNVLDNILNLYIEEHLGAKDISNKLKVSKKLVVRIINMVDKNEFKRRQGPPGIKVTNVAFGKDRRFPITNGFKNY